MQPGQHFKIFWMLAALMVLLPATADAQKGLKGKSQPESDNEGGRTSIRMSGIVPQFDAGVRCPPVVSPFRIADAP